MKKMLISAAAALVLVGCGVTKSDEYFRQYKTVEAPGVDGKLTIAKMVPIKFETTIKREGWGNSGSMDPNANILCTEHELLKVKLGEMEQGVRIDNIINISVNERAREIPNGGGMPVREAECSYIGLAIEYMIAEKPDLCCQAK